MEELLELVEEQTDEDQREDGLTLEPEAIPAVPGGGMEAADGADGPSSGTEADGPPENGARVLWADAGTDRPVRREVIPKAEGGGAGEDALPAWKAPGPDGGAGVTAPGAAGESVQRPEDGRRPAPHGQRDGEEQSGPSWREDEEGGRALDWRRAGALYGALKWAEEGPQGAPIRREAEPPISPRQEQGEAERRRGAAKGTAEARRGLEELYRQAAQAARPVLQAVGGEQAVRMARTGEGETPRQLTVDELDRAVRRDSRRYDGGMSIF